MGVLVAGSLALLASTGCGRGDEDAGDESRRRPRALTRAEQERFSDLTIRRIMQGPGFVGTAPSNPRFSADGLTVFFEWNPPARLDSLSAIEPDSMWHHWKRLRHEAATWTLDVGSGRIARLSREAADTLAPEAWAWDRSRRRRAEIRGGDVYLVDLDRGTTRRVTATVARESQPQVSPDGRVAWFVREGQLFGVSFAGGPPRQVTRLETRDDPDRRRDDPQRRFLARENRRLLGIVRERERERRHERARRPRPHPVWLGKGWRVESIAASPSGRYAAVELARDPDDVRRPKVPRAITRSGYMEFEEVRPMVGDGHETTRLVVVDLAADSLLEIAVDTGWWVASRGWSSVRDELLVRAISEDWHDRDFLLVSPERVGDDGRLVARRLDRYHDDAWVGGPAFYETGDWMPDGRGIWFISEQSGWAHLYTVSRTGRRVQITSGPWEVHDAWIDPDRRAWYVLTTEGRPGSRRLWRMNLDGSDRRLLTPDPGACAPVFAPDMRRAAVLVSRITHPAELYLLDLAGDPALRGPLTESTPRAFRSWSWVEPQAVSFEASDGARVRAHVFRPRDFGVRPNGAGVIFIHGAGYLQNVIDSWGYYYREFLFHQFLASRGYTVLNVDYRGSEGYGRACRVAIYRHMGGRDLEDIVDGARFLVRRYGVDRDRIGVYGGSYGGFLTLMAMFRHGDVFRCGAALRSVTDWAHYNHWYTSRILGLPWEDPEAYRRSSPIYFAEGLRGDLLILHGLADTNVLAEDVLRLSQRLIELGKTHWELMLHPAEGHAYHEASSWTDQIRRVYALFQRTIGPDAPKDH